jgi:WD40 repeat protein
MSAPAVEQPGGLDAQNPWPGLEQFREEDATFFRGRDAEAHELLRLVRRERLTVLFGLSGLGKSSLLQAGVFPAIRAEGCLPVPLRVAYDEAVPSPRAQVLAALARAAEHEGVDAPAADEDASLWEHFHRRGAAYWTADNEPVTPVLVLDQFEEAFTLGRQTPERAAIASAFLDELADLVEGRVPAALRARLDAEPAAAKAFDFNRHAYKVLIAIREDFLADLEMLRARMPSLAGNRMRLVALRGDAAVTVTQAGGETLVPPNVGEEIVRLVGSVGATSGSTNARALHDVIVDPALLSLFCRELNERRKALAQSSISTSLVEGNRESILADFYERSVGDLGPDVRRLVEDRLITEVGGYRDSLALDNALAMSGVTAADVDALVERRLVRREERDGRTRLELTHDVLTDVVRRSRDRRRGEEELVRARAEAERQSAELARAKRSVRRARALTAGMALLVIAALAAGLVAWRQGIAARRSASEANQALATSDFLQAARLTAPGDAPEALARLAGSMRRMPESDGTRDLTFALLERLPSPFETIVADGEMRTVAFSPDGARLLTTGDGGARIFDVATGRPVGPALPQTDFVWWAAYSPDGRRIVTAARDGTVQLWDAATGERGATLRHPYSVSRAVFSPDGRRLLTACKNTVQVWDAASGRKSFTLEYEGPLTFVRSAAFSPDGRRILTAADDHAVRLWDAATGQRLEPTIQLPSIVSSATFSPDGRTILTGGDRGAHIWNATTGAEILPALEHDDWVWSAEYSPDGHRILTASADNTAQVWDAERHRRLLPTLRHQLSVTSAAFSPDGRRVATASGSTVQLWDAPATGERALTLTLLEVARSARFSPDGDRILTAGQWAELRDVRTGASLPQALPAGTEAVRAAFSVDGRRIVTVGDGSAKVWDASTGKQIGAALGRVIDIWSGTFSPDGRRVAIAGDSAAQIWDIESGKPVGRAMRHESDVNDAEFSPDGRRVVTASGDGTAMLWDASSGERVGLVLTHLAHVWSAAFAPDGQRIVTASADSTAQVWNAVTGARLGPPLRHADAVNRATFSRDGRRIVTASDDSTAQVWDAATGARLGPPMRHDGAVFDAAFDRDGQRVVTADEMGHIRIWDVRTGTPADVERLAALAEAVARRRLSTTGAILTIAPESAAATLAALRRDATAASHPAPGSFDEFLRWYFAPPAMRTEFPGAPDLSSDAARRAQQRAFSAQR